MKMFEKKWVLVISLLAMVLCMTMPASAYEWCFSGGGVCDSGFIGCGLDNSNQPCMPIIAETHAPQGSNVAFAYYSIQDVAVKCQGRTEHYHANDSYVAAVPTINYYGDRYSVLPVPSDCQVGDRLNAYYPENDFVEMYWTIEAPIAPVASFTCTPTTQAIDSSVVCTDSSLNTPTSWYWVIDDETRDIHPLQTSTSRHYTWQTHYPGLYSVNLRAINSAGSDWENKTNYVNITTQPLPTPTPTPEPTPAPGDVRSHFITIDATTQATIYDTNIMLYDTYRGTWTNWTNDADGMGYIDTLPYTPINAYATYTKFSNTYIDAQLLGVSAGNSGLDWRISMYPYQGAPVGYTTLYVTTMALQGGTIPNTQVTAIWNSIQHVTSSGSYGTAIFTVPNNTQVSLTARHQGYLDGTKVVNVGSGSTYSTMIYLNDLSYTVTPTITHTTGPGGTVPTTIGPFGTPGPSGTYAPGYTNNQGQKMLDFLATNGMGLVELCFMVTILAFLGFKLGK